jgi:ribosomal protein L11
MAASTKRQKEAMRRQHTTTNHQTNHIGYATYPRRDDMTVKQINYKVTIERKENSRVSVPPTTKQWKEAMRMQETTQQPTKQAILAIRLTVVVTT